MASVEDTSLYGGKPYPSWENEDFVLPGYQNCRIIYQSIKNKTTMYTWGFMISPSSLNIQYGTDIQTNKTMAGWIISRGGQSLGSLTMSGYFLDTLRAPERLRFFEAYTKYGQDNQNKYMEFVSEWAQEIIIEGVKYYGIIQNITQTKSGNQQFLYQYSISFVFYKSTPVYAFNDEQSMTADQIRLQTGIYSKRDQFAVSSSSEGISASISEGVYNILNKL